ncbi:hypothetical protein AGMMS49944_01000 [Spirochaetia bacterium]|nr:hypothetical protein AGMMS49944_01000 [Spirochaetia bacterium]
MHTKKITVLTLLFVLTVVSAVTVPAVFAADTNPSATRQSVVYTIRDSVDVLGNKYLKYSSQLPSLQAIVNDDGGVTVCAADEIAHDTYIYEYSRDMNLLKTYKFHNELETLGAFTKDSARNYYFFYANDVPEGAFAQNNMAFAKYSPDGTKIKTFYLAAQTSDEKWARGYSGVKIPFDAGTCRLEISGDLIAVYFAREMFRAQDGLNHQASYGFILNKDTLERLPGIKMPSAGHSFNQFILPFEDGFIFADHGDAGPRSFAFAKVQNGSTIKEIQSFQFEGPSGQNATYAEMGSLAKTSNGYIFAGSYGKVQNKPRNLFVLTFDDNLTACSDPVYLTGYTENTGHVAHPKITAMDGGRYLLLWEKCAFSTASGFGNEATAYLSTYMLIIDAQGKPLSQVKTLPGIRLNMNDTLRYNVQTKKVYWAINDGKQSILTFALDPAASITLNPADLEVAAGAAEFDTTSIGTGNTRYIKINKYTGTKTTLIIPDTINGLPVKVIGTEAFTFAKLSKITLPKGLTDMEDKAFWYSEITEMIIPGGVTTIGNASFQNCKKLATVTISGTATIGNFAFLECTSLASITISPALTSAGYGAFKGCTGLSSSNRAELIRRFGARAFGE